MSSSNAGSRLFGDEDPFVIVNSDEDITVIVAPHKNKKKRIVKVGDRAKSKKTKTDVPLKETAWPSVETVPVATESVQKTLLEAGPSIVPPVMSAASMAYLVQLRKLREDLATTRVERDEALFEVVTLEEKARQVQAKDAEIVKVQAKYDELDEEMKSFASLHISKEELHQWCTAFMYRMISTGGMAAALEEVNLVVTKCGAHRVGVAGLKRLDQDRPIKAKWFKQLLMEDPKKTMHEAMVKGASEKDPIPEVPDEYMGIELEDADEESEEDVADTSHSGVQRTVKDASQAPSKDPSNDPSNDPFPGSDVDLLDAMRTHNVKVNQHLINKIKGLREEMQRREVQSLKDHSDSLTFEAEIHDKLVTMEKENARLRASHGYIEREVSRDRASYRICCSTAKYSAGQQCRLLGFRASIENSGSSKSELSRGAVDEGARSGHRDRGPKGQIESVCESP
ncbi:OLC1v1004867C1 [Oldenlandia corymbosa var. corymbosa]|uniref:OLC1v1004867C1 n=1 Tax=Oldenlandia corymbosa var. corymbosa TaxID=529605 RepID=A0AAV1DDB8_OLDCO|nr:OLC1v1004867C1 [Oldenlandia corymbosa var. corymbosa]